MSDLAIDTLVGLTTRLREAGDAATASEALALAQTIAQDESLVPTRAPSGNVAIPPNPFRSS